MKIGKAVIFILNRFLRLLLALLFTLLLLIAGLAVVLSTESGFQRVLRSADSFAGPVFSVEQIEGRPFADFRLGKMQVKLDGVVDVTVDTFSFSWNPKAFFNRNLMIHSIVLQGFEVHLPKNNKEDKKREKDFPVILPDIKLPFGLRIDIEDLRLHGGQIYFSGQYRPFIIKEFILQASARNNQVSQAAQVTIKRLKLDSPKYGADVQGHIEFREAWPLDIHGDWRMANYEINHLNGSIKAEGDLNSLAVSLALTTPAEVTLQGQVTDILNDLHWQVAAETGHFHLNDLKVGVPVDGSLTIVEASGTAGSYRGTLAADIHYQGYPKVRAEAKVIAENYSGLTIDYLSVHHDAATLTARGEMNWSGGFSWQAELEGEQFDPSLFAAKWPGKINGLIRSEGKLSAAEQSMRLNIDNLKGELVGYPFDAGGDLELDPQGINIKELHLQSGSNSLRIDGRVGVGNSLDLKVGASVDDLSTLMPAYKGAVQLQGTATGSRDNPGISLTIKGSDLKMENYTLHSLLVELNADLLMKGRNSGMTVNDFRLLLDETASVTAVGQVGWADGLSWRAELTGEQLDPSLFLPEWPGKITTKIQSQGKKTADKLVADVQLEHLDGELRGYPLSGDGKVGIDGKAIRIDKLRLKSGSSHMQLDGQLDDKTLHFSLQAQSDDLQTLTPELSGTFQLRAAAAGSPNNPNLRLTLDGSELAFKEYSLHNLKTDLDADLNLRGEDSGVTVNKLHLLLDDKSSLLAAGRVGWVDGLSWQVDLAGEQLDPSLFLAEWPGAFDTRLQSHGRMAADKLIAEVQLDHLDGKLRDLPLSGSGNAKINGKALLVDDLNLHFGSGFVQINGSADLESQLDLSFQAGADDLASLLPESSGTFQLEGTVSGSAQQPDLALTVNGSGLKMKDYGVKSLEGEIKADLAADGKIDAEVKAAGIRVKEEKIDTALLRVKGSAERHNLIFSAASRSGKIRKVQLAAAGGIKERRWQGELARLSVSSEQFGRWKTKKPVDLLLSKTNCEVSGFTLAHDRLLIALNGEWEQQDGWRVDAKVDDFDLSLLKEWSLPVPDIDGAVTASLTAKGRGGIPEEAKVSVSLPDLSLTTENYDEGEEESAKNWHWTKNTIEARFSNNTARLQARTLFQDGSDAALDLTVKNCGDFTSPEKMPLSGKLTLNLKDLSPVAQLSNDIVQATGEFGGTVHLNGTVSKPTLNGNLALKNGKGKNQEPLDGEIHILAAGISLNELKLAVDGDTSSNKVDLRIASGEGSIRAEGTVRKSSTKRSTQQWLVDLSISGENFQAADLPEYQAIISPNLRFVYGETGTVLSGTVTLPKAKIAPTGFSGSVSSSKDVIIIDEDGKPESGTSPMSLDLTVTMGEEVALDTFGLKGFLDGSLKINAKPGRPITALGNLYLRDGTFDFEGNILDLSQGRVFYQGGPVDDPGLDIQASRKIDKVELGVRLTGSANSMVMSLFSDTAMDESEILSYLLTGQDISKSSSEKDKDALSPAAAALGKVGGGVLLKSVNPLGALNMEDVVDLSIGGGDDASDVSLVMGKEIYKDLYISYGKDLTGAGGTFKACYDLKYGFSVETATNSKTNGADLLWSLER
jgi:translocation and assembly module TamB